VTDETSPRGAGGQAGRPIMPAGYGIATGREGLLPWAWVEERLASARTYWLATTRPDGRPHVMPVWGLWLEGAFYFSTARRSRKARNLAARPQAVAHLESGDEAVILEGPVHEVTDAALLARFADAYEAKYRFRPDPQDAANGSSVLRPRVVFAWREQDFPTSATRWRVAG
jgi:nitroimidazol reductase NimA-like FMN-containing flavoprotein (pyridoxamine 5'-phosphate oxidase superfamily)